MEKEATVSQQTKLSIIGSAGLAFCGVLVETSMNVTFPTLMRQFHESLNNVQWVTTAYLLVVAATMTITAFIQRRLKYKTILGTAGVLFMLGIIFSGTAHSLMTLLIGRIIQGVSTGLVMPLMFAIIMHQVPLQKQGQYVGMAGMVVAFAPSLGPTYGGFITQMYSWPLIFWLTLPLGIICCLLAWFTIQQVQQPRKLAFPIGEFLLILLGLISLTLAVNQAGGGHLLIPGVYGSFIFSLACFALFAYTALHSQAPLINIKIFANSRFSRAVLIYFFVQFVQIGLTFLLPTFAQLPLHKGVMLSGMMLLGGSLLSAIIAPFTGRLLDQHSVKLPFTIGSGFILLGVGLLLIFTSQLTTGTIVCFYAIYMLGFSFIFNNALTFGLQQLSPNEIADGNAVFNTLQQYSGSLGTAIAAAILAMTNFRTPGLSAIQQTTLGSRFVLILFAVLCLVTILLIVSLPSQKSSSSKA
ncbi:DHA2 family efflux MFS transporter permease subunit [Pediococcus siamensis]|uniref:DHA2 family efflux MFS transporter permease subunit n=1 Tax=Pediococcus siamensis TaxID=381829 RepID=UPI0039A15343